jgi:hypothetical protein
MGETCKIPCFVCDKTLPSFDQHHNHPAQGIEFRTYGHYGSTVFDPMDSSELIVNICDQCLLEGIKHQKVLHHTVGAYAETQTIYNIGSRMPPVFETGES